MTKLLYGPAILFTALLFSNCKTITSPTIVSKKSSSKENYNPDEIIVIVELKMFGLLDANYVVLRFAYELTFVWDATQKFVPDRISLMNAWFFPSELVQL